MLRDKNMDLAEVKKLQVFKTSTTEFDCKDCLVVLIDSLEYLQKDVSVFFTGGRHEIRKR